MDWQVHCYGDAAPPLKPSVTIEVYRFTDFHGHPKQRTRAKNAAYLIRPDGHIGMVESGSDGADIRLH